jgi:hypothetical protein
MESACTRMESACAPLKLPLMKTPSVPLPLMRFLAAGVVPPTTAWDGASPWMSTPSSPLPLSMVPVGSVPMKLPSTRVPNVGPNTKMPLNGKRFTTRPLTTLLDVTISSPLVPWGALVPSSWTLREASLPTALVLGEAPGWV